MKVTNTNANSHGMVSLQLPPNSTSPENSNSHHGHNSVKVHVTRHTDLKYESESMERGGIQVIALHSGGKPRCG
jgi:hypothetical protein